MKKLFNKKKFRAFSLIEVAVVILIIGIFVAGIAASGKLINKFRLVSAENLTKASPINNIKDNVLWLETSLGSSIADGQDSDGAAVTEWGNQTSSGAKSAIVAVGSGATYANTINRVHAVKFSGSTANYLQISDASSLNDTDYTIFILEKRQSNGANNYFLGENPSASANQTLALGYSSDSTVIHSQGTGNSYSSNVSAYSDSKDKPRQFTFVHSATEGNKTYINGLLAAQDATKTSHLSGIASLAIGKGYTGEIGEIAIFTKALTNEARISVEDYLATKWERKNNRKAVSDGSCTSGVVTDSGCSMDCSTASILGVSSPTSVADGQSGVSATCGQTGYSGTITVGCSGGSVTKSGDCSCASGYSNVSGTCVQKCPVSVTGVTTPTSVDIGSGILNCDTANHFAGTVPYTCASGNTITGACTCETGYTGAACSSCDTANGYQMISGTCQKSCSITGQNGVVNTTVLSGSTSTNCNTVAGYYGSFTYTCSNGTLSNIVNNCKIDCTGGTITKSNGKTIHTFKTSGTFTCPEAKTARLLIVGGGGGGGCFDGGNAGGGGGGGGLIYNTNYSISVASYTVTVGAGNTALKDGIDSSFTGGGTTISAFGGEAGRLLSNSLGGKGSGGGGDYAYGVLRAPGNGTSGQGNRGGTSYAAAGANSGGGGGACGVGANGAAGSPAKGGDGCAIDIDGDGTSVYYAGGGAGNGSSGLGVGGAGGGGGSNISANGNGVANTGGGAGSCGTGGSGIVIVAY